MIEKTEFNKHLGQFIKLKREQLGLSQSDVAAQMLKASAKNISRLERGEVTPSLYWWLQLSSSLDIEAGVLLSEFEKYIQKKAK